MLADAWESYTFLITSEKQLKLVAGSGIFRFAGMRRDGNGCWLYSFRLNGKPGDSCGFYLNGSKLLVAVATIR